MSNKPVVGTPDDVREALVTALKAWQDSHYDYIVWFSYPSLANEIYDTIIQPLMEAADQKGFYRGIDKAIATDEKALEKLYAASDKRVEAARTEERERIIGDIKMHTTSTTADKQMGDGWIKMHLSYHKEYWQSITGGE